MDGSLRDTEAGDGGVSDHERNEHGERQPGATRSSDERVQRSRSREP
jgi:hypothetical protein